MCNLERIEARIKIWCDSGQISKSYSIENEVENVELPKSLVQSLDRKINEDVLPRSLISCSPNVYENN